MRVLHISDLHILANFAEVPWRDWMGKRLIGFLNLALRRAHRFKEAKVKVEALSQFLKSEQVDLVLCTGDYTTLGTVVELQEARRVIQELLQTPLGFVTIPGNHDIYLQDCVEEKRFENFFGDLLRTDLPSERMDGLWPVVRFFGNDVAVVAVNSAKPNPLPWHSSGRIPSSQLQALSHLLDDPRLRERFVFVMTHHTPYRKDGSPDHAHHGLENADEFLQACQHLHQGVVLHGHIHWRYSLQASAGEPRFFGSGSTTHKGREGLWLFEITPSNISAIPGAWNGSGYGLEPSSAVFLR